jgi:hypothetical protein
VARGHRQNSTGGKGDGPDANEARRGKAIKLTLATPATPAGAANVALAPLRAIDLGAAKWLRYVVEKSSSPELHDEA